jgi:hypothetical protein
VEGYRQCCKRPRQPRSAHMWRFLRRSSGSDHKGKSGLLFTFERLETLRVFFFLHPTSLVWENQQPSTTCNLFIVLTFEDPFLCKMTKTRPKNQQSKPSKVKNRDFEQVRALQIAR